MRRETVMQSVVLERLRQEEKWGNEHDLTHTPDEWFNMIADYNHWARAQAYMGGEQGHENWRRRMIQVAALAFAALEADNDSSE